MQTIYWHDYETFGANPSTDRPCQFAGVRTNLELEVIGEPMTIYCQPVVDMLPSPEACLITGILPEYAAQHGLPEYQFMDRIHREFSQPQTCGAGYNSIRFDDEVTRYGLYRNFFDPYAREWKNGNSRWDIIDMVRLVHALRPKALVWPQSESGATSFKLELLSAANGLVHDAAHDAFSDVTATIELARLIRARERRLYQYCWELRSKHEVAKKFDFSRHKPVFHVSSKIPASRYCSSVVMPLCLQSGNKNAVVVVDLCQEPEILFDLNASQLRERLYTPSDGLANDQPRVPIKSIHLNRSPVVLPVNILDNEACNRLQIDLAVCERRWRQILAEPGIVEKVSQIFEVEYEANTDVESALYQGFLADSDRRTADQVRSASAQQIREQSFVFEDQRMSDLLERYKARHFPNALDAKELAIWREQVSEKYIRSSSDKSSLLDRYKADIEMRLQESGQSARDLEILNGLKSWALRFEREFNI